MILKSYPTWLKWGIFGTLPFLLIFSFLFIGYSMDFEFKLNSFFFIIISLITIFIIFSLGGLLYSNLNNKISIKTGLSFLSIYLMFVFLDILLGIITLLRSKTWGEGPGFLSIILASPFSIFYSIFFKPSSFFHSIGLTGINFFYATLLLSIVSGIIGYFLLGYIIGWIIQKYQSKK